MQNSSALMDAARAARGNAYVPHSNFPVGAAVLTKSGKIFSGCNVENISLRLTICAEEVAVGAAVAAGEREFVAVAVIADSEKPIMPCGACRQLLAEFNADIEVLSGKTDGTVERHSLAELLPRPKQGILDKDQ